MQMGTFQRNWHETLLQKNIFLLFIPHSKACPSAGMPKADSIRRVKINWKNYLPKAEN
jgi:hypothetical protein